MRPAGVFPDTPLLLFVSAAVAIVTGGSEQEVELDEVVLRARASGGDTRVERGRVWWHTPPVCRRASVALSVQTGEGRERRLVFEITPGELTPPRVVHLAGADGLDELQVSSEAPLRFAASVGSVEDGSFGERCALARWRREPSPRPDWAVAAAFGADGTLVVWRAIPTVAQTLQEVEAPAGEPVIVTVGGWSFAGRADGDGVARVRVEVPPLVDQASVESAGETVLHDLAPPPTTAEHSLVAPDGGRWLFRLDAGGRASDGVAPEGAERIAPGVYRFSPSPKAVTEIDVGERDDSARPAFAGGDGAPARVRLRVAGAAHLGPSIRRGLAGMAGVSRRVGALEPAATAVVLHSGIVNQEIGGNRVFDEEVLAAGVWLDVAWHWPIGPFRAAPVLAVGGTWSRRRARVDGAVTSEERRVGPVAAGGLRGSFGLLEIEARLLWSPLDLRPDTSRFGLLLGLGVAWPP